MMIDNKLELLEHNLFQFFYTFGLDPATALSDDLYKRIKGQEKRIEFIQPKTINKFPQFNNTYANISDEVIVKHVFSKGFFVEYSLNPNPYSFFFSLDNFPFNEIARKIYYVALVFNESLNEYHNIKLAYDNFEMNQKEKEEGSGMANGGVSKEEDTSFRNYYVPKAICLASLLPFPSESILILQSLLKTYSLSKESSQVQIEKIIETLVLCVHYPPRGQYTVIFPLLGATYVFSQTPINKVPNSSILLPLIFAKLKIEEVLKIFKCLLLELPILFFSKEPFLLSTVCEGFLSLLFPFRYQWPHVSILPVSNYSLIEVCDSFFFGINEDYSKSFFEKYSIEPETKTIFAVDLEKGEIHQLRPDQSIKQNIILGQSVDPFQETFNMFEQIEMPIHYKKKFHTRLVTLIQKIKEDKNKLERKIEYNPQIREDFFYFLVSILNDYAKYIKIQSEFIQKANAERINQKVDISIDKIYNVIEYISNIGGVEQVFYKRLLNTKMFKDFILKKINPVSIEDKMEIMFFDERIVRKKNKYFFSRSVKTPLLESSTFENKSTISIFERKTFSNSELIALSTSEYRKKALTYYQQILSNNKGDTIEFKSLVFPKLLYDNEFFNKNYISIYKCNNMPQGYNIQQQALDEMQKLIKNPHYLEIYKETGYSFNLMQEIKKHRTDGNKLSAEGKDEKESDYIDYSWLIIFTLCFSYCDDKEKEERFYEMLKVLRRMKPIQENVLMFVFFGILKYGSNSQRIKLFEEFISSHNVNYYITYATLCAYMTRDLNSKVSKCNDPTTSPMKVTLLMRENAKETEATESNEELDSSLKEVNSHRSLGNTYIENNTEFIYFSNEYKCLQCSKLSPFTFEDKFKLPAQSDKSFKCPQCSKPFIPQVTVQVTEDKCEVVNMMTPLQLYETIFGYMTINSYKIDVETFKQKYPEVFWNLVFYFDYKELPFDFLIPYRQGKVVSMSKGESNNYFFSELAVSCNTLAYEYNYEPIMQSIEGGKKSGCVMQKRRISCIESKNSITCQKEVFSLDSSKKRSSSEKRKTKKLYM